MPHLKDLFIPHEGNNYKPHALHPRRLFFHAVAAAVTKVLLIIFLASFPVQAWLSADVLVGQGKRIIALTNDIRSRLKINLLKENELLSQAAMAKAQDMLVGQYFAHIGPNKKSLKSFLDLYKYNYKVAGENLALGFARPADVVEAWTKSPTHYANLVDPDFSEIGVGVVSGAYGSFDTTLVAQFFGQPKLALPAAPESATVAEGDATVNSINNADHIPQILSAEIKSVSLPVPRLVAPADKFITAQSLVELRILAPQADKITVWDNGQVIFSAAAQETMVISQTFAPGEHQLIIGSQRGEDTAISSVYRLTIDQSAPVLDDERSFITASETADSQSTILRAEAYLSSDTKTAYINLAGQNIPLFRDFSTEDKWTGHMVISDRDRETLFQPLLLASLTAHDIAGNRSVSDINWQNIVVNQATALDQYAFLKQTKPQVAKPLFDISHTYYKIILLVAIAAALLNIFIKIRIQRASVVLSSLAFIFFIGLLIFF